MERTHKIKNQIDSIFRVHDRIINISEKEKLHSPLIFAGMAVYLYCNFENFRPHCDRLSGDIDYIIPPVDIPEWESALQLRFQYDKNRGFSGSMAKTKIAGIEVDLLADAEFIRPIDDIHFHCRFFYNELEKKQTNRENRRFLHVDAAQLLFFKLLLGRGLDKNKYDFEDAAALILDAHIDEQHFFDVVFKQNDYSDQRVKILAARLQKCVEIDANTASFRDGFLELIKN
ncbi:MAG: hypothetical protein H6696_10095 [Deferribacteres bacterium]|nr:hypothetical protein [candidate division KSB1 bacterium]MCB9502279.1 hypothetical protein [Deferribacteres bacterium]